MPDIKDSVGEGGANLTHDVALVQAMLRVVKNAKGGPYLGGVYDGVYGGQTKAAITSFQLDNKLAEASKAPPAGMDKLGLVKAASATLKKLSASLPAEYATMRIIPTTRTVYLEGEAADAKANEVKIAGDANLEPTFRQNVALLVNLMYVNHKIVLSIARGGGRRTFAEQAAIDPTATGAGPGESNHNFGQAVDIGFNGLKWLQGDGTIVRDDWWLNKLGKVSAAKSNALWGARNAIAFKPPVAIFKTNKPGDLIHVQRYSDDKISMARSLAALLNVVGATKWKAAPASPNRYKSDLGLGGKTYDVGTSKQIWAGNAAVTKTMLAEAQSAKLKKVVKEADIKAADLAIMQITLKADFQAADTNWTKWTPVS